MQLKQINQSARCAKQGKDSIVEVFATSAAVAMLRHVKYVVALIQMLMEVNAATVNTKNFLMSKEVKMGGYNNMN
jgi:hypothetical protein